MGKTKEELQEYRRQYRLAHVEHKREQRRQDRAANPEKYKARARAYYLAHREEIIAKQKQYYLSHPEHQEKERQYSIAWKRAHPEEAKERAKKASAKWRAAHLEETRSYDRRHRLENLEADAAKTARRRANKAAVTHDLTADQWKAIKAAYKNCCAYCGKHFQRLTQDHVIPLSKGGPTTANNIVPACRVCNARKGARPLPVGTALRVLLT